MTTLTSLHNTDSAENVDIAKEILKYTDFMSEGKIYTNYR